ncbi:MAG: BlaI/MecI/CopY family transcriptional regulator [Planctomycetota bacterium]
MSQPNLQITDAEWDVMEAVWADDEQAAGEIIALVQASRDWNHRTIRTLLRRLVEKGAVTVRVDGSKHLYRAGVSKQECVRSATQSFTQRFFSGDVRSLLMHFVENEAISKEELDEIRRSLSNNKSSSTTKRKKGR